MVRFCPKSERKWCKAEVLLRSCLLEDYGLAYCRNKRHILSHIYIFLPYVNSLVTLLRVHCCWIWICWIWKASAKSSEIRIKTDRNSFTHTHYKQIWTPSISVRGDDVTIEPLECPLRQRVPWLLYADAPEIGQNLRGVRVTRSWTWSSSLSCVVLPFIDLHYNTIFAGLTFLLLVRHCSIYIFIIVMIIQNYYH